MKFDSTAIKELLNDPGYRAAIENWGGFIFIKLCPFSKSSGLAPEDVCLDTCYRVFTDCDKNKCPCSFYGYEEVKNFVNLCLTRIKDPSKIETKKVTSKKSRRKR